MTSLKVFFEINNFEAMKVLYIMWRCGFRGLRKLKYQTPNSHLKPTLQRLVRKNVKVNLVLMLVLMLVVLVKYVTGITEACVSFINLRAPSLKQGSNFWSA